MDNELVNIGCVYLTTFANALSIEITEGEFIHREFGEERDLLLTLPNITSKMTFSR